MLRSTKIVATLGPASSDPTILERMIRAGVDVVRLNFSHGTAADHEGRAALVKELATKTGRTVAILCDLQGPKIRVGKFAEGKVLLETEPPVLDESRRAIPQRNAFIMSSLLQSVVKSGTAVKARQALKRDDLYELFSKDIDLQIGVVLNIARVLSRRLRIRNQQRAS